jgi:hypothetical protein
MKRSVLEARVFTERQVMKIHELKGFSNTKFVNFIKLCDNFVSKFFKTEYIKFLCKTCYFIEINFFILKKHF